MKSIDYTPPKEDPPAEPRDKHETAAEDYVDPDTFPENRYPNGKLKTHCEVRRRSAMPAWTSQKFAPSAGPTCPRASSAQSAKRPRISTPREWLVPPAAGTATGPCCFPGSVEEEGDL
ncbi:unnamed protein product [Effrenium voratum]|nr:unnamed protein product [Effrenium voratum]